MVAAYERTDKALFTCFLVVRRSNKTYEVQVITVHKFNSGLIGDIQSVELFKYEKLITRQH